MQEYLHPFVGSTHNVCAKKAVRCKLLVILMLKAVNVARQRRHCLEEGSFPTEVVPGQAHKYLCAVVDILGRGNHVDLLVQDPTHFFLGELVMSHRKQDLPPNGNILSAILAFWRQRGK